MTTEEKARAYDEAMKRADSLTEKYGGRDFAEYVFPELAESDDERIRKKIIENVRLSGGYTDEEIDEMISWLEKQKEPQYAIRVTKGFGDPAGPQFELVDLQKEQKPAEWSEELKNELAKKHLDGYIMGREDIMREMRDFLESHFNTQSGTSRRQRDEQH